LVFPLAVHPRLRISGAFLQRRRYAGTLTGPACGTKGSCGSAGAAGPRAW
jgi:hypothetical protein